MSAKKLIENEIEQKFVGHIFSANEFIEFASIKRARDILLELSKEGKIEKINSSLYGKQQNSTLFGKIPIGSTKIILYLLTSNQKGTMIGGTALYNKYGLTTQNTVVVTLLNNKANYVKTFLAGYPIRIRYKKINIPITSFNIKLIEILEIIKLKDEAPDVNTSCVIRWLLDNITKMSHTYLTRLPSLAIKYYPKKVSVVLYFLFEHLENSKRIDSIGKRIISKQLDALRKNIMRLSHKDLNVEQLKITKAIIGYIF